MRFASVAALLAAAFAVAAPTAAAAPFGEHDATFSGDGWTTLTSGTDHHAAGSAVAVLPDHGVVTAGTASVGGETHVALTKHTAAGALDSAFGNGGIVLQEVGNAGSATVNEMVRLSDGSFVVAGSARDAGLTKSMLARFTADGDPHPGFGTGGVKLYDVGDTGNSAFAVIDATTDGKLIVAGVARDGAASKPCVARVALDGQLDTGFAEDGVRCLVLGQNGGFPSVAGVHALTGGGVAVTGSYSEGTTRIGFVAKLTAAGARDASFGDAGVATLSVPDRRVLFTVSAVDAQGRFVVGGSLTDSSFDTTNHIFRLTSAGGLDPSFGGTGTADVSPDDGAPNGVQLMPDGRIAYSFSANVGSNPLLGAFGSGILEEDGDPDTGYAGTGEQIDQQSSGETTNGEFVADLALDGDRLVLAGRHAFTVFGGFLSEDHRFGIAKYEPNGDPVTAFSNGDVSQIVGTTTSAFAQDVAVTTGDGVLASGYIVDGLRLKGGIWRLGADGTPLASFSGDGLALAPFDNSVLGSAFDAVTPGPAGSVFAGGFADAFQADPIVVKYTAAGVPDTTFSGDGVLELPADNPSTDVDPACGGTPVLCRDDDGENGDGGDVVGLLLLGDGDLLAFGFAGDVDFTRGGADADRLMVARINPNGTLDSGFGTGGVMQISQQGKFRTWLGRGSSTFAELAGGKVAIPVAFTDDFGSGQPGVLRIDAASGAPDTSFSGDGYASAGAPTAVDPIDGLALSDGRTLLHAADSDFSGPGYVGRLLATGALDGGFGSGGFRSLSTPDTRGGADGIAWRPTDGEIAVAVAHRPTNGTPEAPAVVGLTDAGAIDPDFGAAGLLAVPRSCGSFTASSLAWDSAGRLVMATTGRDPALGGAIGLGRHKSGAPSAPVPCPPSGGSASLQSSATPLKCNPSNFRGSLPLTYAYQWLREKTVVGTAQEYTPTGDDAGHLLACRVTATNAYGTAVAVSGVYRVPGTVFVEPESGPPPATGGGGDGGDGGGGQTSQPPPAPPASPPGPAPATPPLVGPPAPAPRVAQLLTLPSSRRCASRRKFTVRVRRQIRGTVKRVTIFLNGKRVKSVTGSRIGLPIDLRGLPKGKIKVRLRVELKDGRIATDTRTYRTCATKKRKGRFGRRRSR
jgi:uncharacterized delta-60 repeat protein